MTKQTIEPVSDVAALRAALEGTELASRDLRVLDVPGSSERVFAVSVDAGERFGRWHEARCALDRTGRWPVMTDLALWDGGDLLSRDPFANESDGNDVSPAALRARARNVDVSAFLAGLEDCDRYALDDDVIDGQLWHTEKRFGEAPTRAAVHRARVDGSPLKRLMDVERWLFEWELERFGKDAWSGESGHVTPFDPTDPLMLFLPTAKGHETLAYLSWYPTEGRGSHNCIALMRSWSERFDAELVAHYGGAIELTVARPPTDPRVAFALAREQALVAPDTWDRRGISVRGLARDLLGSETWDLFHGP